MGVYLWHKVKIESYISVPAFRFHQYLTAAQSYTTALGSRSGSQNTDISRKVNEL